MDPVRTGTHFHRLARTDTRGRSGARDTGGFHELGNTTQARTHLSQAQEHLDALNDDDYGQGIRSAIQRLAAQLAEADPTGPMHDETK
ncbi:hypothetical protein AB0L59_26165 [Streptomyces sp. NPDC052109]|uniref:hypothetical protein n=1 Tax=Streptomyces sp. NPDC052109 TaxID=3155527 RepID=UPI003433E3BD